jgi:hypothetical protein
VRRIFIFRNARDRIIPAEAGLQPQYFMPAEAGIRSFQKLHGFPASGPRKNGTKGRFSKVFYPYCREPAFENKGSRRLKFLPGKYDIYLEARQNQVKRRNDS